MTFFLGVIVGALGSLAISSILLEMRERRLSRSGKYKYSKSITKVRNMRMTGMTVREISKQTGIPKSTVHRYLYVEHS